MSVKYTKEADLRPFNIKVSFVFGLQDVEDYAYSILVVISDDSLVCIGSVRLDDAAFLLACFGWLVIFQLNCSRV